MQRGHSLTPCAVLGDKIAHICGEGRVEGGLESLRRTSKSSMDQSPNPDQVGRDVTENFNPQKGWGL